MNKKYVITIARQRGSGGLKIGKRIAEELGICCYDSEMLRIVSGTVDGHAINENDIARFAKDERLANTSLIDVAKEQISGVALPRESDDYDSMKDLFIYQSKIIKALAERESCVIVGRCANYILRDNPNLVSVYVHAPLQYRVNRLSYIMDGTNKEIENHIKVRDRHKAEYYKYYTGAEWTDITEYDLGLNSGVLGIQKCVDEIKAYMKVRFEEDF